MDKSPDAFRTISEVAELLETPAHVLRFWETRFPQIRPVKRAGGRRYYRPADLALLTGIKHLLHDEGMTIRGVQKMLREQGVRHVAGLSGQEVPDEGEAAEAALEAALAANFAPPATETLPQEAAESAQIVALESALRARQAQSAAADEALTPPAALESASIDAAKAETAAATSLPAAAAPEISPSDVSPSATPPSERAPSEPDDADELPLFALHSAPRPAAPLAAPPAPPSAPPAAPAASGQSLTPQMLLARLRALPQGSLASDEARGLRDRLAALQAHMAAPPAPPPGSSPL